MGNVLITSDLLGKRILYSLLLLAYIVLLFIIYRLQLYNIFNVVQIVFKICVTKYIHIYIFVCVWISTLIFVYLCLFNITISESNSPKYLKIFLNNALMEVQDVLWLV
jgi:hypothetical protein